MCESYIYIGSLLAVLSKPQDRMMSSPPPEPLLTTALEEGAWASYKLGSSLAVLSKPQDRMRSSPPPEPLVATTLEERACQF